MNSPIRVRNEWTESFIKQDLMHIFRNKGFIKTIAPTCPFLTIPNGLKQHPLPVGIIHSAQFKGFRRKLPDTSIR
jgi:hypothetical protein